MQKGVITKVWPKKGRGPGSVVFSDGEKYATFSDATLNLANSLIGQLVSYTLEQNGEYTNLGKITPLGKAAVDPERERTSEAPARPAAPAIDLQLREYAKRIAEALEDLVSEVRVQNGQTSSTADVGVPPTREISDPVAAMQSRLAEEVGDNSAEAMFSALKKKHKSPEKLEAAARALLADHGITYGAAEGEA